MSHYIKEAGSCCYGHASMSMGYYEVFCDGLWNLHMHYMAWTVTASCKMLIVLIVACIAGGIVVRERKSFEVLASKP